jgi:pilus assembly protein CpaF
MTATGQQTADQIVEDEVRELVRRRGLDPGNGDAVAVRQLIDEVVTDYADRRLVASMPPLTDAGQVAKAVADRVIGMGPLQPFFDDPDVEEIWINEPGKVFVAKAGRPQLTTTVLSEEHVHDLVELMLRASGRRVDLSSPFVVKLVPDEIGCPEEGAWTSGSTPASASPRTRPRRPARPSSGSWSAARP